MALLHVTEQTDRDGLDTQELRTERCVAVLPGIHPLAGRSALHLADLDGLAEGGVQVLRGAAATKMRVAWSAATTSRAVAAFVRAAVAVAEGSAPVAAQR